MSSRASTPSWSFETLRSRALWALRAQTTVGAGVRKIGRVWVYGGGEIRIGDRVVLDGSRAPIELHVCKGAKLELEEGVSIEGGTSIEVIASVRLGAGAHIGAWVKILDNHFHPLSGAREVRPASEPIEIGPGVHIGERCVVLPGTRLEAGVRLGPGVVISRRVPAGLRLEGSPPRRVSQ